MDIKGIKELYGPQEARVEALIQATLSSDIALLDQTNRQLRAHPGKMLRPLLALVVASACGGITEDTIRFAAAAELLHNSTLLHDDVVDGATERRGVPTVAKLLNSSAAVLLGDYWLTRTLKVVLSADHDADRVLRIFSSTLGHLAEGELLQMQKAAEGDTTQEDYLRIIYGKTASLFEATALSAAISAGAPEAQVQAVGKYARNLGTAFQIKDDIFDYAAPAEEIGKPVGIDLKEQKITQPLLCALEKVSPEEASAVRSRVTRVADEPSLADGIRAFVYAHAGVEDASAKMEEMVEEALSALDALEDSAEKSYLVSLAHYVTGRSV